MPTSLNPATPEFLDHLRGILPSACFKKATSHYLEEPRGLFKGQAVGVLVPSNTQEAALIMRACADARVGVIPFGGGTGLVGGQVQVEGPLPVIVSMERMKHIRDVDPTDNVIVVDAGVVLADIQAAADKADRLFPLSLASEGTCQIGGNLATNAGGVGVLRYGNARDLCLGLEAVLPDGTIWHGLKRLRKDNTGYDIKNLLIGAEGSLGLITAASLKLMPKPARFFTALVDVKDPGAALVLLGNFQRKFGGLVSGFELIHRQGVEFLQEKLPDIRVPSVNSSPWMVLVELGLHSGIKSDALFEALLAEAFEAQLATDALIAQNETQRRDFWAMRESIPEANRLVGAISSHDISLPIGQIPHFIAAAESRIAKIGPFRINCFGHLGDGNLHYNIYPPKGQTRDAFKSARADVKEAVYGLVHTLGGSVSAEHGIGRLKIDDLVRYGSPVKISAMQALKLALDPVGIMNPGAVIPT